MPTVTKTIDETRRRLAAAKGKIGLVPTMGALHEGHATLFRQARESSDFVVASVFVNPTQFGPNEDFHRYPRPIDSDIAVCEAAGVDLIFNPDIPTIYPPGFQTFVEVRDLQHPLCGHTRPTHFRGVATVVLKLLQIVRPDLVYFGQKDAQQARLLLQMVRDLDVPVEVIVCPIVREPDGLAMSSRNRYLSPEQRKNAPALFQALEEVRRMVEAGERCTTVLRNAALRRIASTPGARFDYVEIVSWETLEPIDPIAGEILVAMAVYFGTTRLIDNWRTTVS
jgi:pantoate--beta-alanine ligase